MQERQHVKTVPGEPKAPEVVPNPIRPLPGGNAQTDDINIPMVAVSVAFFGVLLLVTIFAVEAWVYHYDTAERAAKQVPQYDTRTELGQMVETQKSELNDPAGPNAEFPKADKVTRMPISDAMNAVVKQYAAAQGKGQ